MMKTFCLCCLAALCCSCVRQKPQAKEPAPIDTISINQYQWTFEKIEFTEDSVPLSDMVKDYIKQLKNLVVEVRNDTIIVNHRYRAHFKRTKAETEWVFVSKHPDDNYYIKKYYVDTYAKRNMDVRDSIPFWECDYDNTQKDEEGFDDFFAFFIHYTFQTSLIGDKKHVSFACLNRIVAWYKSPETQAEKP